MRGEPYTSCKLRVAWGEVPTPETFLIGRTMAYHVDRVAGATLHCTRWPLDEVPADALTIKWSWARRSVDARSGSIRPTQSAVMTARPPRQPAEIAR